MNFTPRYFDAELARLAHPETREAECERCGGSGLASYSHPNDPSPREFRCDECDGSGTVTVRTTLAEEEDLFADDRDGISAARFAEQKRAGR
jgi:hypothetical protein